MTSSRADTQEPSVHIMATDHAVRARSSALSCIIGQDIVILPDVLGKYCVRELTARVDDLVVLAGVVAFADRAVQRKAASAWSRALHLTLPVHDRAFWERPESVTALTQTLDALTGDKWSFAFRPRTKQTPVNPQATLALSGQQCTVIPFSDGLDSLAVAQRRDYHDDPTEEFFYQLKGNISLRIMETPGKPPLEIPIKEGEIFLLPKHLRHSPRRPAETIGVVVEVPRPEGSLDAFEWYRSEERRVGKES